MHNGDKARAGKAGFTPNAGQLGEVDLQEEKLPDEQLEKLDAALKAVGFEKKRKH